MNNVEFVLKSPVAEKFSISFSSNRFLYRVESLSSLFNSIACPTIYKVCNQESLKKKISLRHKQIILLVELLLLKLHGITLFACMLTSWWQSRKAHKTKVLGLSCKGFFWVGLRLDWRKVFYEDLCFCVWKACETFSGY